jgi:hypothetical protein
MEPENINELSWGAESFLTVCKEHKERCTGECNVSMFFLGNIFKEIVHRELTEDEKNIFI